MVSAHHGVPVGLTGRPRPSVPADVVLDVVPLTAGVDALRSDATLRRVSDQPPARPVRAAPAVGRCSRDRARPGGHCRLRHRLSGGQRARGRCARSRGLADSHAHARRATWHRPQRASRRPAEQPAAPHTDACAGDHARASPFEHTIARGESLTYIAGLYCTTVEEILELNGIANPNRIQVDQVILIPGGGCESPTAPADAVRAAARASSADRRLVGSEVGVGLERRDRRPATRRIGRSVGQAALVVGDHEHVLEPIERGHWLDQRGLEELVRRALDVDDRADQQALGVGRADARRRARCRRSRPTRRALTASVAGMLVICSGRSPLPWMSPMARLVSISPATFDARVADQQHAAEVAADLDHLADQRAALGDHRIVDARCRRPCRGRC